MLEAYWGSLKAKIRITKESSLYNVVIIISVTSIKTALIDKNMLSIKKQITRTADYQKKKPTMEYNEKLYEIYMKI